MNETPHDPPASERERLRTALQEALEEEPGIQFAYLHGSFAEGRPFRDLDVGAWLEPEPEDPLRWTIKTSVRLTRKVGAVVDARVLNRAPLGFQCHVTGGQVLLDRAPSRRLDWVERTWLLWLDYEPLVRASLREILGLPPGRATRPRKASRATSSSSRKIRPSSRNRHP